MAVSYNNIDVDAANKYGIVVGNTPGVLTETTAELAAALSLGAARRIVEADAFMKDEPHMKLGLANMKNAIVVPHIASASKWTREGMATLAALNVLGQIKGYPVRADPNNVEPFLNENVPPLAACPSIVNPKALGLPVSKP